MKKILVPIDFSTTADNAVNYAIALAKVMGSEIVLLHTYQVMNTTGMFISVESYIKGDVAKQMLKVAKKIEAELGASRVSTKIIKGDFVSVVVDIFNKQDFDLLLMGTEGANSVFETISGTYTSEVINKTKKAVLAIPDEATYKPLQNIVFAVDQKRIQGPEVVAPLVSLAKAYDALIRIYHVEADDEDKGIDFTIEASLENVQHAFHYEMDADAISKHIEEFVEDYKPELLCMIRRKRPFVEQIFHKSATRREVLYSVIPLLILFEPSNDPS